MKVYFIGIGGIGVSALAQYYLKTGHQVSGSDLASSELTDMLKKMGAEIFLGPHKKKNISKDTNLIIYSPAVQSENPEFKKARQLKIKCQSYPQALGELTKKYFTIAVSGTHGKSTTTAMIAEILIKAGLDPTVVIGTKLKEFGNSNFRMGSQHPTSNIQHPILVIEADEHFASFLNYWPKIIVLTNIEKDHLDYYKNLNNILLAFRKYISYLPPKGILVVNRDDKNIRRMLNPKSETTAHIHMGWAPPLHTGAVVLNPKQIQNSKFQILNYSLKQPEAKKLKRILKVPGEHNVYNTLAALAVARILKVPDKISFKALSEYKGAWRRFELSHAKLRGTPHQTSTSSVGTGQAKRGTTQKITLISDYAHHPTEIKATLKATREKFARKKIWCVFQPHQYQRTYYLFSDFVKVFVDAIRLGWIDKLILIDIYDVVGREEKKIKKIVSSKKLVQAINKQQTIYIPTIEKTANYLRKNLKGGEVVIVMGAGDIYKLCEQF